MGIPVEIDAIARPLGALNALGQLLACTDRTKWASLARPEGEGLSTLVFMIHAELAEAVADFAPPAP